MQVREKRKLKYQVINPINHSAKVAIIIVIARNYLILTGKIRANIYAFCGNQMILRLDSAILSRFQLMVPKSAIDFSFCMNGVGAPPKIKTLTLRFSDVDFQSPFFDISTFQYFFPNDLPRP